MIANSLCFLLLIEVGFCFQGSPEKKLSEGVEECPRSGEGIAPGGAGPGLIRPFLDGEGVMLYGIPGTLSNSLHHYRDDFISWIDPHVSKSVGRVLLGLYNQVLDQLEVELDAAKDCLEESASLERRWVKTILSMAEKRARLETENDQRFTDLRAERDEAR